MRAAASRAPGKDVWAPHSSVGAKAKKSTKDATAAARAGPTPSATRSARAEALVRHVSQLPAYLAWAPANAPPTPGLVAQYLEAQVAEVATQLEPIRQAGNYERLVLLLAELLHGDLACGITPGAVRSGVLRIVHGCVTAIAAGELGAFAEPVWVAAERATPTTAAVRSPLLRSPGATLGSTTTASVLRVASGAAPIESLLPPLIDQPARTGAGAAASTEDERATAEMEVWENYMATARAATTAEDVHRGTGTATGRAAAAVAMPPALEATAAHLLGSLPEALCALIDHCTTGPLVCLTLSDQQCVEAAVQDVLAALLATLTCLECDAAATPAASAGGDAAMAVSTSSAAASARLAETGAATLAERCQAVRLAAVEGISRVLATYLGGAETGAKGPSRMGKSNTGPLPAATVPSAGLDSFGILAVFEGVTQQWAHVLAALVREQEACVHRAATKDPDDSLSGGGGSLHEADAAGRPEGGNGTLQCAAEQLHWFLRTAYQIIAAAQHEATRAVARAAAAQSPALPSRLVPVALRTLSFVATAPALASRATTYAQLIVDVLWGAVLLAPRAAALQFMYASLAADSVDATGTPAARPPAMDLFLALLHQFNVGHSVTHCELRDDLLCLLAFLLRHDTQFVEDDLVARRGVTSGPRRASLASTSSPASAPASPQHEGGAPVSPLHLRPATVDALNAVAALLFETTCGAELTTTASRTGATATTAEAVLARDGNARDEGAASMLLSREAARRHALRFQSIATSAARRRELLEFKKYGWQLLEAHGGWQLAHLTHREFVHYHDTSASAAAAAVRHQQRTAPVEPAVREEGEEGNEAAATTALWALQLSQLGFLDVLLLYVDTRTEEPAVVAWTREALVQLEMEAWRLLTSMILFTQHLDTCSGGVRAQRHRRCGGTSPGATPRALAQQPQRRDASSPPRASPELRSAGDAHESGDSDLDDGGDDEPARVLYGADTHFIAAGGVQVALRFVRTAPAEVEHVKRAALVTLAAIARTSSSGEACGPANSRTDQELALVKMALTQHAPSLVPFLVKLIQEVDTFVDAVGVPAAVPPLISSVVAHGAAPLLQQAHGWRPSHVEGGGGGGVFETTVHGGARWNWLPQSAEHCALIAWCLLRCIGDVVLAEVGTVRELALPMLDEDDTEDGGDASANEESLNAEDDERAEVETRGTHSTAAAGNGSHLGSAPRDSSAAHQSRELFEGQWENTVDLSLSNASSSGSSMGPLEPVNRAGPSTGVTAEQRRSVASSKVTGRISYSTSPGNGPLAESGHPRTLLRSVHSHVLRIPELFAEHNGVDLLTSWMRHGLDICLTAHPKRSAKQAPHGRQRTAAELREVPQLTAEEVAELGKYSDHFLLLFDVFRAIVLGCQANEMQFVESGGVHGMLDLVEAYALAHGLIHQAARHARATNAGVSAAATATTTTAASQHRERDGVLSYGTTLLSDLLESCPRAIDAFATWRSRHILASPLTSDTQESRLRGEDGIEAVQLLLCLWASEMPAREAGAACELSGPPTGLQLLRLHLRPALRTALKEAYVSRLLQRRAKLGVLEAEAIRSYYRYLHTDGTTTAATESVPDAVVLAYMEKLMSRRGRGGSSAVAPEQQIALLVYGALGLCMKVYACLSTVGFDSLRAAEAETQTAPSMGVRLSALERSYLVQVAALPTLCVDEIAVTMAEVALEDDGIATAPTATSTTPADADGAPSASRDDAAWRPTTPDRRVLRAAAEEAAVRAGELDQLVEVGAQVQQARESQLYNRFLVTQLRQPVGQPADGRPGAVRGTWKTQRRQSTTRGGAYAEGDRHGAAVYAADLAAGLSTRFAEEQLQQQQSMAATVRAKQLQQQQQQSLAGARAGRTAGGAEDAAEPTLVGLEAHARTSAVLGSSRTPYASLMDSVNAAAHERLPVTPYSLVPTPQRPSVPLTERHQQRQAMIARSLRKLPHDPPSHVGPHTR